MISRSAILHRIPEQVAAGEAALRETGWLLRTSETFRDALFDIGIWKSAQPGDTFIRSGDTEGGLVGIAIGTAEVSMDAGHPDTRFVDLAYPGTWAGFRPLLGKPRNVSYTARTQVLWLLVPRLAMRRLLAERPEFWQFITLLADIAYEAATAIMVDLTRQHGRSRAAAALLRMSGCRFEDPSPVDEVNLCLSQSDLAAIAVMARNTIGIHLAELAAMGLIEIRYRGVRILSTKGLRALLESEE